MARKQNKQHRRRGGSFNQKVKRVIYREAESKYIDATVSDTSLINTDARSLDNALDWDGIVQGDSVNERIGSSIFCRGLQVNLLFTTTVSASLRIMMIGFPNSEAGLDLSPLDAVGVNGLLPRQDDIEARYKVLWQRNLDIDPDLKGSVAIKKYVRLNKKIVYKDGQSQPYLNKCKLYVFTNNTTGSAVTATADVRIFYKDL